MVERRTLTPLVLVRIQVPQPNLFLPTFKNNMLIKIRRIFNAIQSYQSRLKAV